MKSDARCRCLSWRRVGQLDCLIDEARQLFSIEKRLRLTRVLSVMVFSRVVVDAIELIEVGRCRMRVSAAAYLSNDLAEIVVGAEQPREGAAIVGLSDKGERLVQSAEFYAAFLTADQWDVVCSNRKIGWISLANALSPGDRFCLDGTGWQVIHPDARHNRLSVMPAASGGIPVFDSRTWEEVHEELASEMRRVLEDDHIPLDLDRIAARHLTEGRAAYASSNLKSQIFLSDGEDCHLLSWKGGRFNRLSDLLAKTRQYFPTRKWTSL